MRQGGGRGGGGGGGHGVLVFCVYLNVSVLPESLKLSSEQLDNVFDTFP